MLAGALLVGDSVRGSLRDLVLQRLGRVDRIVVSTGFFREALADEICAGSRRSRRRSPTSAPIVVVPGFVTDRRPDGARRACRSTASTIASGASTASRTAADRTRAARSSAARSPPTSARRPAARSLVRVERPSAIPIESLHGRKDDLGPHAAADRPRRARARRSSATSRCGRSRETCARCSFRCERLQQDLDQAGRVNALLVVGSPAPRPRSDGSLEALLKQHVTLEDFGLTLRPLERRTRSSLESRAGLHRSRARPRVERGRGGQPGVAAQPVLTYLANALRSGDRQVPYSLVTAIDLQSIAPSADARHPARSAADRHQRLDRARSRRRRSAIR